MPPVVHDRVAHLAQVAVQNLDHPFRLKLLGEAGEAAQVAEEDGALAPHAAEAEVSSSVRASTSLTTACGTKRAKVSWTRWRSKR